MFSHESIYRDQADRYDKLIGKQPSLAGPIRAIRNWRGLDVADLGAGTGRLACMMAPEAKSLVCTDASAAMLAVLEKKLRSLRLANWRTVVADHRRIPLADASVDLTIAGWTFCYLASADVPDWERNTERMIGEVRRLLRPDGTSVIIETLGTGTGRPAPPGFLQPYYRLLEDRYGYTRIEVPLDYRFDDSEEAEELTAFFFGEDVSRRVARNGWSSVPEFAGIWYKHGGAPSIKG
ncbi:class I SAM-dependent methyltransferase [Paenibacillus flagellatus]|uniref:class I SAM-dependent methyltransferase n=1 Tax=Paenibacillus flagellatus TaxID=2211139 RepID=UPI001B871B7F|nr:class I SAM-dependent methyltransferase [Paenibacillus flagellatus]